MAIEQRVFIPNAEDRAGTTGVPQLENFGTASIPERASLIKDLNAQLAAIKSGQMPGDQRDEIVARRKAVQGYQAVAKMNQRSSSGPIYK